MLIGLVSAKGSPGVTTTALALAGVPGPGPERLFVELDPAGGDVECWTGQTGEPGLVRVVSDLRRAAHSDALLMHAVDVPCGVRSVLAPTAEPEAASTIAVAGERLGPALDAIGGVVVVDGGRWSSGQPTARRLAGCAVIGVVCAPTLAGVEHGRWLVESLRRTLDVTVAVVLVGARPYSADEVAAVVDAPVAGTMAWDPRGVNALMVGGTGRGWGRCALARSARAVLEGLLTLGHTDDVAVSADA